MKKIMSLLVVFALMATMLLTTAFAADGAVVTVGSVDAKAGETVTLDVSISGNPGFAAAKFVLKYDATVLTLTDIDTTGKLMAGGAKNVAKGIVNTAATENITADGVLFTATFTVAANANAATKVSVEVDTLANEDDVDLSSSVVDGIVNIPHVHGAPVGAPVFKWADDYSACVAEYVCSECGETVTVDCVVKSEMTKEPTTEAEGEMTYTASVTIAGKEYTDVRTKALPKVHVHGAIVSGPVFKWSTDYKTCVAEYVCECGETVTVECKVNSVMTKEPTTEAEGEIQHTASVTIGGKEYTDVKYQKLDKLPVEPAPETADSFSAIYMMAALIAAAGAVLVLKKKAA